MTDTPDERAARLRNSDCRHIAAVASQEEHIFCAADCNRCVAAEIRAAAIEARQATLEECERTVTAIQQENQVPVRDAYDRGYNNACGDILNHLFTAIRALGKKSHQHTWTKRDEDFTELVTEGMGEEIRNE